MMRLFIISCWIRLITQAGWKFLEYDKPYSVGIAFFEASALGLALYGKLRMTNWYRYQLSFFLFCALWDLFKYLFLDPYGMYLGDYINVGISAIVTIIIILYGRYSKRAWK
jgi:branched-subunit amino acid transport protein